MLSFKLVIKGDCLLTKYDEKIIQDVLDAMLPHRCLVFLYNDKSLPDDEVKYKVMKALLP